MTGTPEGTKNISEGKSFNLKMFIDEDEWKKLEKNEWKSFKECMFSVEKEIGKKTEVISPQNPNNKHEDLLSVTSDLRIFVKDNTGNGSLQGLSGQSRSAFYATHKSNKILQIAVPLQIKVTKYEKLSKTEVPIGKNEMDVVFEILDPYENWMDVEGPRASPSGRTGVTFLGKFLDNLTPVTGSSRGLQSDNDNCITDFAPRAFGNRCRDDGKKLIASKLMYQKVGSKYNVLPPVLGTAKSASKPELARIAVPEDGKVTVYFRPPPILADNYILQITVRNKDGEELPLKDDSGKKVDCFKTPAITIWKRLKIQMAIHQKGATYAAMKWDEIRNAFKDAFIEIEEPPADRQIAIDMDEWFGYLDKYVYGTENIYNRHGWRRDAWTRYKDAKEKDADRKADFQKFSFPQVKSNETQRFRYKSRTASYKLRRTPVAGIKKVSVGSGAAATTYIIGTDYLLSGNYSDSVQWFGGGNHPAEDAFFSVEYESYGLVPPNKKPDTNLNCGNIMGLLAKNIMKDKLGPQQFTKFGNSYSDAGKEIGMCYLMCHRPSPTSDVGGRFDGGKRFFFTDSGDLPNFFVHEMGHALFLNHGATKVIKAWDTDTGADYPYVVRYGKGFGGNSGPAWNEHDSEDMTSCVMSYLNHYYYNGAVRPKCVDWHFCGVCLKKLRLYDTNNMASSDKPLFRKLLYQETPIKILRMTEDIAVKGEEAAGNLSSTFSLEKGKETDILALYPKEGVSNNLGDDPYKDLSEFCAENVVLFSADKKTRTVTKKGKWIIEKTNIARVREPRMKSDIWVSTLIAKGRVGKTKIWFEITHGPNVSDKIRSNPVELEVK